MAAYYCGVLCGVYTIQQKSSKLPANVFKNTLDVCWTFAGSCKHPIILLVATFNYQSVDDRTKQFPKYFTSGVA